jgi:hypothetical protein
MKIRVIYKNSVSHTINASKLDELIVSGKVAAFRRSDFWAIIGVTSIRGTGGAYNGPERRRRELVTDVNNNYANWDSGE